MNLSGSQTEGAVHGVVHVQPSENLMTQNPTKNTKSLKQTPLHRLHHTLGARMDEFSGFEMPINYPEGILREHNHCRNSACLFDVSHMNQFIMRKSGRPTDVSLGLERLVPGNINGLHKGQQCYTMFTNEQGGVIDDIIVCRDSDYFRIIGNGSRLNIDQAVLKRGLSPDISVEHLDSALIALQGPKADLVLRRHASDLALLQFMYGEKTQIAGVDCWVSRSGYTGEDGYEISIPKDKALEIVELLLGEDEVMPAGLGARDSLRLEAGLCLYGNDLTESITPIEAGLHWTIPKRRREQNHFPGSSVILRQLKEGAQRYRVGIQPSGRTIARKGTQIFNTSQQLLGFITSGGYGPTARHPISIGYVVRAFSNIGQSLQLEVRNKKIKASVTALPFVKHEYHRN